MAKLEEIRADLGECTRCKLHEGRKNIVFGVGDPQARLMFVGEGPGADEDAKGEPFVGRAGKKLDEMIAAIGLSREEVYIANIIKCRPPQNRDPQPDEVGHLLAVSVPTDRGDRPTGHRGPGVSRGQDAAQHPCRDHQAARDLARLRGCPGDADVPPGLPAARLHTGEPAQGLGRPQGRARACGRVFVRDAPGDPCYASVAVPVPVRRLFTYEVGAALGATLAAGSRVRVPFGRRKVVGTVVEWPAARPSRAWRSSRIDEVLAHVGPLPAGLLELTRFCGGLLPLLVGRGDRDGVATRIPARCHAAAPYAARLPRIPTRCRSGRWPRNGSWRRFPPTAARNRWRRSKRTGAAPFARWPTKAGSR